MNSLDISYERLQWVDFSLPYFEGREGVAVRSDAPEVLNYRNLTYLKTREPKSIMWNRKNSDYFYNVYAAHVFVKNVSEALDRIDSELYPKFRSYALPYDWFALNKLDRSKYRLLDKSLGEKYYGAAFQKNKNTYRSLWDDFFSKISANGKYNILYRKWFKKALPVVIENTPPRYVRQKQCWDDMPSVTWKYKDTIEFDEGTDLGKNIVDYLPFLSCDSVAPGVNKDDGRVGDENQYYRFMGGVIQKYYKPEYGKVMLELYDKRSGSNAIEGTYRKFALDNGVYELVQRFIRRQGAGSVWYDKEFLSEYYLKHTDQRNKILSLYKQIENEERKPYLEFQACPSSGSDIVMDITVETAGGARQVRVLGKDVAAGGDIRGTEYCDKKFRINVFGYDAVSGQAIVGAKGVKGTLVSMKTYTDFDSSTIVYNLNDNTHNRVANVGRFLRIDPASGQIITELNGYELRSSSNKNEVVSIQNYARPLHEELMSKENVAITKLQMDGWSVSASGVGDAGATYVLATKRDQITNGDYAENNMKVILVDDNGTLSEVAQIPYAMNIGYRYLIKNKLYLSSNDEYSGYYPPIVVDIRSGHVKKIRTVGGAAMVPVGNGEIFYCDDKNKFFIDVETDEKNDASKVKLGCPYKYGSLIPYSKPGYIIVNEAHGD